MPLCLIGPATLINVEGEYRRVLRDAGFDLVFPPRPAQMTEAELMDRLQGCEAVLAGSETYNRKVLDAQPQLRVIARAGVGFDAVDVPTCTERDIAVMIAPANAEGVAEHAFGLMLALAKEIIPQHQSIKAGGWPRLSYRPLRGTTLGLIGLGRTGKAVASRAVAFRMRVIAYDPVPDREFSQKHGVELREAPDIYIEGDFVSLHLPLNDQTRQSIDARSFDLMKKSAFLINTARGGVVRESALYEALRDGRIAGAGLDVLEPEPPVKENPLLQLPNVVLTAHTAGVDTRSRDDMALIAAKGIVEYLKGGWPAELIVNPDVKRV